MKYVIRYKLDTLVAYWSIQSTWTVDINQVAIYERLEHAQKVTDWIVQQRRGVPQIVAVER